MDTNRIIKPKVLFPDNPKVTKQLQDIINRSILSINTQNSISSFVGGGEITIVPMAEELQITAPEIADVLHKLYHVCEPQDKILVTIEDVDGVINKDWLVVGLVDNILRTEAKNNNQTQRGITIRFSNLVGKLLTKDETTFLPPDITGNPDVQELLGKDRLFFYNGGAGVGLQTETGQNVFMGGTIDKAIKYIIQTMVLKYRRKDIYARNDSYSDPRDILNRLNLSQYTGSIVELLNSVIDKQFYELFTDTINDTACLVYRPTPFDREQWNNLETHDIDYQEVLNDSTGYSDYEAKTVFRCYSDYDINGSQDNGFLQLQHLLVLLNLDGIKRYGVRQLDGRSTTVSIRDQVVTQTEKRSPVTDPATDKWDDAKFNGKSPLDRKQFKEANQTWSEITPSKQTLSVNECDPNFTEIIRKRNKLYRWYGYPFYETGNITIRGRQKIRAGSRIFLPYKLSKRASNTGMIFYATQVSHNYTFGQGFKTSIALTRGQEQTGREVYEYLAGVKLIGYDAERVMDI